MTKKLGPFVFKHYVLSQTDVVGSIPTKSWYWVSTNLALDVYKCEDLRNVIGLWEEGYARSQADCPSIIVVNNSQELCRMGVCGEITCTVKAVDNKKVYLPFAEQHTTTFVFEMRKSLKEVADSLLAKTFKFGPTKAEYRVIPGTIKQKKRKATTARLG